jgi:hypothetical protein
MFVNTIFAVNVEFGEFIFEATLMLMPVSHFFRAETLPLRICPGYSEE